MTNRETLLQILDIARWAPSGDNTQPWRFEIVDDKNIAIHGYDTREWCVYDFQGRASHMAHGGLIETIRIAATAHGLKATWRLREKTPDTAPIYDIKIDTDSTIKRDPLVDFIEKRMVQRRPMKTAALIESHRSALRVAASAGYTIQFFESFADRLKVARLLWKNAHIRLTCPEAYLVHKKIIEWGATFSQDRIPERAVGVDPLTAKLMQWVMQSWERLDFFNRYLFGTIAPRIQLDFFPALFCASHLIIKVDKAPNTLTDFVKAGIVMQRVWLTCAANGLLLQPEMTPIVFNWYATQKQNISRLDTVNKEVKELAGHFYKLVEQRESNSFPIFMCRIGISEQPSSRSTRMPLNTLMWGQQ